MFANVLEGLLMAIGFPLLTVILWLAVGLLVELSGIHGLDDDKGGDY